MPINPKIIIVLVIIAVAIGGGLYWNEVQKQKAFEKLAQEQDQKLQSIKQTILSKSNFDTAGWKTYHSSTYGFEIKYPNYLTEKKKDNGKEIILGYRIAREQYGDMTIAYGASSDLTPLDLAGPSEKLYKMIAWLGLNKDQYLKIISAKSNLFHASYNATGHVNEVAIFSNGVGKMVMAVFEYHESNSLPIDQILSTFKFTK